MRLRPLRSEATRGRVLTLRRILAFAALLIAGVAWNGMSLGSRSVAPADAGGHSDAGGLGRRLPQPQLLDRQEAAAGWYMQQAGGLTPAASGKPPALVVRYAACGGLFNQHYCHIAGVAMAIALGADGVIMPQAMRRNKFAVDARNATWMTAPASSVWDLRRLRAYAATKGVAVHEIPTLLPHWVPDGLGAFNPYGLSRHQILRFPYLANELYSMEEFVALARERVGLYLQHLTQGPNAKEHPRMRWREVGGELIADLRAQVPHWATLREASASRHREDSLLRTDPRINMSDWAEGAQVWELMGKYLVNQTFAAEWGFPLDRGPDDVIPNDLSDPNLQDGWVKPVDGGGGHTAYKLHAAPDRLELLLPCTLFGVASQHSPLMSEVALNLDFAPRLHAAAARITAGIAKRSGRSVFNGLHLRLEADASAWIEMFGGLHQLWQFYIGAAKQAGLDTSTPLYIASGIFSSMTPANRRHLARLRRVAASVIFDKTQFLAPRELRALHSEQRAAVDFLVLTQSRGFVGFKTSTFSRFVHEHRKLHGWTGPAPVFVDVPALHEFTKEMMRQGAKFNKFPALDSH